MNKKKTKEEILNHLLERGYQREEIGKIMAYLIGSGYKKIEEAIPYKTGVHTFIEFIDWINKEPQTNMCKEIATGLDYFMSHVRTSEDVKEKTWSQITWLNKNNDFIEKCFENRERIERYLKITEPIQEETANKLNRMFEKMNSEQKKFLECMEESWKY